MGDAADRKKVHITSKKARLEKKQASEIIMKQESVLYG